MNRTAEIIFGQEASKVKGLTLKDIFTSNTLRDFEYVIKRAKSSEVIVDYETIYEHKDGVIFHLGLTPSIIKDKDGRFSGTVIICRDLFTAEEMNRLREIDRTRAQELRNMNEELRKIREKLIQSDRLSSIGKIAAGMAHEINNPLGAISGYIQLLKMLKKRERKQLGQV